ncbi:MAG: AGE family epimerase/isomerase, partial [Bacteroidales bacterium]
GHDIDSAWLLRESAMAIEDQQEIDRFSDVCVNLANSAMEAIRPIGGLIHEYDRIKEIEEEYEWWAQAEAIVGFLEAWKITGDEKYLDIASGIREFIEKYFVDKHYGEWYYRVNKEGKPLEGYEKAGFWKCPYHSVRMCLEILKH